MSEPIYEYGKCFVERKAKGLYYVYRSSSTHAVRIGTYHFPEKESYALDRAKEHCVKSAEMMGDKA